MADKTTTNGHVADPEAGLAMLRGTMQRNPAKAPPEPLRAGSLARQVIQQMPPPREDGHELADAYRKRECLSCLAGQLGKRYSLERTSLDRFEIYHRSQQEAINRVTALAQQIENHVKQGGGLLLYGPCGTGKDHLLAALLYHAAAAGISCRWTSGQEVFGQLRDNIDTGKRDEDFFRQLAEPTVLGVSDLLPPAGNLSAWDTTNLFRLVDRRYRDLKATWLTLNITTPEEADQRLSAPVFDRLRQNAELIPCFWPSFRDRKGVPAS